MSQGDILLLLLGIATLAARIGLCLYLSGQSRSKNAAAAVSRVAADIFVAVLASWAVGAAILRGQWSGLFAWDGAMDNAGGFFYFTMVLIATGAAAGATLERTRLFVPLIGSLLLAGLVTPLAMRWAQSGWLYRLGFIDDGGASFLHLCGASFALAGACIAGPRSGKYNHDGSVNMIPGHDFTQITVGAMLLVAGLLAQITQCTNPHTAPQAAGNVLLAAAAGGLAGLIVGRARYMVADPHFALTGMIGGVVAVAAAAGRLPTISVVLVAIVAGILAPLACVWIDVNRRIDDPSSAVGIHGFAALWGLIATGLLVPGSGSHLRQTAIQLAGAAAIAGLALVVAFALFLILRATVGLRLSEADELDGGDLAEHDLNAYPDFQQNMIKSYHLRET